MRILFIKLRHIGDSLLLTPTIVATKAKFPDAEIWVLVRKSCDAILAGCPEIDRILTTANPDAAKRNHSDWIADIKLAALLRRTDFDFVFELTDNDRARFFAIAARTPNRCANKHPTLRWFWRLFFHRVCQTPRFRSHQVWRDYVCPMETLALPPDPGPLRFAESRMAPWQESDYGNGEPFAVLHLHTRWERKSWPIERWEALIPQLLQLVPRLLISCGPDATEIQSARSLCATFGSIVQTTAGTANWSQLAWLLRRARFFVGVDTAAMHLAAACRCQTVALFGPSPAYEYQPWMVHHWIIRPKTPIHSKESASFRMRDITLDAVLAACTEANGSINTAQIPPSPRYRPPQRTLFFLANLDPLDGSAHALYCLRNVISLSKNAPQDWKIEFLHASNSRSEDILKLHQASACPNLELTGLPHLRRGRGYPFHLNAVFHYAVLRHLRKRAKNGDIVCTASFPEMFRFIAGKLPKPSVQLVYEVHQLEILTRDQSHTKCMREFEALSKANKFITTSLPLVEILKSRYARTPCYNLGLASTYQSFASKRAKNTPFQIGFLGSLYEGQGVHWLAENWKIIRKLSGDKHSLHVYAMTRKGDTPLNGSPENGVFVKAAVPPSQVPKICEGLDALVIPALSKGRLPFVAFTKAYDYPGLGLPILCSDLPTIREVLEEERHALFFQPGDANGLADCIARLAGNQGLADSMASNLRQRASEFSWDSRARRWWEAVLQ